MLIYTIGDSIASLITAQFSVERSLGIMLIGGTIYALEIPHYFRWIDKFIVSKPGLTTTFKRALLAMAYFNPLWIARHLFFINFFSGNWDAISWSLLETGTLSFTANIPLSLCGNYIIQNKLPFKWRFVGSGIFSGILAIYYALSEVWFGNVRLMEIFTD